MVLPLEAGLRTWEDHSEQDFDEIYAAAEATLCFDMRRVYAIGHASGGRFLQQVICDTATLSPRTELFRAVALQGAMASRRCPQDAIVPTLFIHSEFDSSAQLIDEADNSGALTDLATTNECEMTTSAPELGTCESTATTFECVDYDGCSAPFRSCSHDLRINGRDDWPCFASDEIHRFFTDPDVLSR
jgi:poly(3-hydroxybutyrate) depolymerase